MGFLDRFRRNANSPSQADGAPYVGFIAGSTSEGISFGYDGYPGGRYIDLVVDERGLPTTISLAHMTPAAMWRSQPHLRTVVTFLSRQSGHVPMHTYKRTADDSRERARDSVVSKILRKPNAETTGYELVFALVGDLALHDVAYWYVDVDLDRADGAGYSIQRIPPAWVKRKKADLFTTSKWIVTPPTGHPVEIPADKMLVFPGYDPDNVFGANSPVAALRDALEEQVNSAQYRQQVWKNGGRVSSVLTRPPNAPRWSDPARERFREDWYSHYTGNGPRAGGTPILDDGMTLQKVDYSATDQQYVEGTKLSFQTVCSVYHVNPTMVGMLDNANYSNVREFRRALYGDTLGPLFAQIEDRVNGFLFDMVGEDADVLYVEFNIQEKLQGSFEEQAAVMQTMVGAPVMTQNEGRARFNLPRVEGGDELQTPLNMAPASGADTQTEEIPPTEEQQQAASNVLQFSKRRKVKAAPSADHRLVAEKTVKGYFDRQARSVRAAMGAKAADTDWWDADRWDKELTADLFRVALMVAGDVGRDAAKSLGFNEGSYDEVRTLAFLKAVSERIAGQVNQTTKEALIAALAAGDDQRERALASVWNVAQGPRSVSVAAGVVTTMAGFASVEAAQQLVPDGEAQKQWIAHAGARKSHARMNGETVGLHEKFSNGADWPADWDLSADESAGCRCTVDVITG